MIGKTVSNFEIVEKLGEGGMGVVYRAEDARLKRPVALKFLPQHYTSSADAVERFEREAQSAAALNHPNIITIYEVGEFEGQIYIAMEYVDGRELRDLIGPTLPLPRALEVAVQVADGLHGAHDAGIVHRDIKPENILVTATGRVKILDFGLAKLHGVTRITQESSTVGTLHYMSPEQARGEDVDHRSDIFSFGAVLYEMVTGAAAFPGDNTAAVTHAIINSAPHPLKRFTRDASDELERIVMKCLEKNPEERYQSIKEVLVDLRKVAGISSVATPVPGTTQQRPAARAATTGLGGGPGRYLRWAIPVVVVAAALAVWFLRNPGPGGMTAVDAPPTPSATLIPVEAEPRGKTMIAVLPFQNLGDPGDEYFADGMTEEITSRLASVGDLGVISRTSTMQYKDTKKSLQEIGDELGVEYVLEGTVRWSKSGETDRVRITPQLITVRDDTHLWSDRYDRTLEDIFAVQSEIAQSIVRKLGVSLADDEQEQIDDRPTDNMRAYQAYLRGVDLWRNNDYSEGGLRRAIEAFDEAVRLDPEFCDALQCLASIHSAMAHWGYDRTEQRMALAKGYAQRAVEVDPESFSGYLALGTYYYWCRKNYERALEELDRAAELQPGNADVISMRAWIKRRLGLFHETIADLERVITLDPRDHLVALELGNTYMCLRRFDMARRHYQRSIELAPNNPLSYWYPVILGLVEGNPEASRQVIAHMPEGDDATVESQLWVAYMTRDVEAVRSLVAPERVITAPTVHTPFASMLARLNRALGNRDAARTGFESVREQLRESIAERPRDARLQAELCVVEAALGNRSASEAARERCLEVADPDVYGEPEYYGKFLTAAVFLGDHDDALERLDALLSRPSEVFHPGLFTLEPTVDPLRADPRFDRILAKHQNETF